MNTRELAQEHPKAFEALPECYQADDCLIFWTDHRNLLHCQPKGDQVSILGDWECIFYNNGWWDIELTGGGELK